MTISLLRVAPAKITFDVLNCRQIPVGPLQGVQNSSPGNFLRVQAGMDIRPLKIYIQRGC